MVRLPALACACLLLLAGCATAPGPSCAPGERPGASELLYFGTALPGGGGVDEDAWAEFLRSVVTPRFPGGFTAWRARGQWRAADGRAVHEGSYVLSVVHPVTPEADAALRAVAAEYKARFHQEAVLRVASPACFSF